MVLANTENIEKENALGRLAHFMSFTRTAEDLLKL